MRNRFFVGVNIHLSVMLIPEENVFEKRSTDRRILVIPLVVVTVNTVYILLGTFLIPPQSSNVKLGISSPGRHVGASKLCKQSSAPSSSSPHKYEGPAEEMTGKARALGSDCLSFKPASFMWRPSDLGQCTEITSSSRVLSGKWGQIRMQFIRLLWGWNDIISLKCLALKCIPFLLALFCLHMGDSSLPKNPTCHKQMDCMSRLAALRLPGFSPLR